jgi:hypothetical protein
MNGYFDLVGSANGTTYGYYYDKFGETKKCLCYVNSTQPMISAMMTFDEPLFDEYFIVPWIGSGSFHR